MHEAHSFLFRPVNALLEPVLGFEIPDHVIMGFVILLFITAFSFWFRKQISQEHPGKMQHMLETIVGGLRGLMEDVIGHGMARTYLGIIGAFTFFIFLSNIMGLVFFLNPPTSNPNTTFALSITAFLFYNTEGIKRHGFFKYLKTLMGPVAAIGLFMFAVEAISHAVRIVSLGLRLFGNIFGEHTVSGQFSELLPILVPWPIMMIGIIGATMQTFIFIMLTMAYIGGAVGEEH
ncbi:MAG TPA: FoF1 ATP synthase subunit a [Thermoanaerobaculia bacterium]|nr:FoF1 ATP synthase subunit a [Thermoanaerobaculia bacterium]HUM29541.1 FoF1 ATP synthase subunit a [Thermoanaerobaculia bacterium]HXK67924.1 FoF1 ATP synthase subunit a [Thermoanaerobaculia bacterium]